MFTQEKILNDLFVNYVEKQKNIKDNGGDESAIKLVHNIIVDHNYQEEMSQFVEKYDIYIDTNVFMDARVGKFLSHIIHYLNTFNKKIIIIDAVVRELKYIANDTYKHTAEDNDSAREGLEHVNMLAQGNYIIQKNINWPGKDDVRFADKCFDSIFALERTEKNILLLTFDKKLGRDMIIKNNMTSVETDYYTAVRCINDEGFLIHPAEYYGKTANNIPDKKYTNHVTHGNIDHDMHGDIVENIIGTINGDIEGDIIGTVNGTINGDIEGDITGAVYGTINGDVEGDISGNVIGDINGDVEGDVIGTVKGTINGDVEGDILGTVDGNINGDVEGNISGNVYGDIKGDVEGKITGTVTGVIKRENDDDDNDISIINIINNIIFK